MDRRAGAGARAGRRARRLRAGRSSWRARRSGSSASAPVELRAFPPAEAPWQRVLELLGGGRGRPRRRGAWLQWLRAPGALQRAAAAAPLSRGGCLPPAASPGAPRASACARFGGDRSVCRFYALRATAPTAVRCCLVPAPNSLLAQSRQDLRGFEHADGWGIAAHGGGRAARPRAADEARLGGRAPRRPRPRRRALSRRRGAHPRHHRARPRAARHRRQGRAREHPPVPPRRLDLRAQRHGALFRRDPRRAAGELPTPRIAPRSPAAPTASICST